VSTDVKPNVLTTTNRINAAILRLMCDSPLPRLRACAAHLDLTPEEWVVYQNEQAAAHAAGRITADESRTIYQALGPQFSHSTGGWAAKTHPATKLIVTKVIAELLRTDRCADC
jgi:hypothetical protein